MRTSNLKRPDVKRAPLLVSHEQVQESGVPEPLTGRRIAALDDHEVVLLGFQSMMEGMCGIESITTHMHSASLIDQVRLGEADSVLIDLDLGSNDLRGEEVIELINGMAPEITIVVLSSFNDAGTIRRCLRAGASSVLDKAASVEEIHAHITERTWLRVP